MQLPTVVSRLVPILACLLVSSATPQEPAKQKFGTIFKSEVDGLVSEIRKNAPQSGGFADGSSLRTAQVLCAMGHCHRFYGSNDGPVVRGAIKHLFSHRRSDGAFTDENGDAVESTSWAVDALSVIDPEAYRDDIAAAKKWLEARGAEPNGFDTVVDRVRERATQGESPVHVGEEYAELADAQSSADRVQALVGLVACQVVARELDAGEVKTPAGGGFGKVAQDGMDFLLKQQKGGVFFVKTPAGEFPDTGLTALGIAALQTKPQSLRTAEEQAAIDAGLKHLIAEQNDDGSFAQRNANYTTCAAILALAKANRPEFKEALQKAQHYILAIQNIEDRGYASSDRDYGSIGYGGDQRGDLSNLQFAVQALRESGLQADHEAFAKAVVFLQRTQNLKSVNDFEGRVRTEDGDWQRVTSGDDGGAAYYPGNSPAGYIELPDGRMIPRSYGSMTYAMLKTYTLAGVPGDDPRVQAAVGWIEKNWDLSVNPGADPSLPEKARYQGLYYYFMVLAQALSAAGIDELAVPADDGEATNAVDWRAELAEHLKGLQRDDGSWVNERNGRWWEDQPVICTIYSLIALEHTRR